jgi:hypothetical protein
VLGAPIRLACWMHWSSREPDMPTKTEILAGLARAAGDGFVIALAWHVLVAAAVVAAFVGWRPARRTLELLLCLPLVSVSALAFAVGNPFNGLVFALLAGGLAALAMRASRAPSFEDRHWGWSAYVGVALAALAGVYPHFVEGHSLLAYLVAAPMGVVPCPTLMLVIGVALLAGRRGRRAWNLLLAAAGAFYGAIGVFQLGIVIDLALLLGAVPLFALGIAPARQKAEAAPMDRPPLRI